MNNKFLVPTDGSVQAEKAVEKAMELAKKMNYEVTVIHVTPNVSPLLVSPYTGPASDAFKTVIEEFERKGTTLLNNIKQKYADSGVKTTTKMVHGDPSIEITAEAEKGGYEMIIMSNRGLSNVKEFLMGGVSSRVVKHAKCTVMIVK